VKLKFGPQVYSVFGTDATIPAGQNSYAMTLVSNANFGFRVRMLKAVVSGYWTDSTGLIKVPNLFFFSIRDNGLGYIRGQGYKGTFGAGSAFNNNIVHYISPENLPAIIPINIIIEPTTWFILDFGFNTNVLTALNDQINASIELHAIEWPASKL
jgi:hypothetical protein